MAGPADSRNFLRDIVADKRREVGLMKQAGGIKALRQLIDKAPPARSLEQALTMAGQPRIIAEIKRRSPSKGTLAGPIDVVRLAAEYASAGACALSVLTDNAYFGGSTEDLAAAKRSGDIPVLRKEFIIDEFQVYESRALGADSLLLIVRLLGNGIGAYIRLSRKLGMEPLVEVHSEDELSTALDAGARMVGINSRNLETFEIDTDVVKKLAGHIPDTVYTIAESGIASATTIAEFLRLGIDGFLIGEALMCADSPAKKLRELISGFKTSLSTERR